jgi:hypothetical protein
VSLRIIRAHRAAVGFGPTDVPSESWSELDAHPRCIVHHQIILYRALKRKTASLGVRECTSVSSRCGPHRSRQNSGHLGVLSCSVQYDLLNEALLVSACSAMKQTNSLADSIGDAGSSLIVYRGILVRHSLGRCRPTQHHSECTV